MASLVFSVANILVQFLAIFNPPIDGINDIGTSVTDLGFVWRRLDSVQRRFLEYRPESLAENPALVITFHGMAANPQIDYEPGTPTFAELLDFAEEKGFLLLAPEASSSFLFLIMRVWNDYGRSWLQPGRRIDDVAFTEALIDWAVAERGVDRSRVFVAGVSGGGSLVYRLLNERSQLFAGAAVLITSMLEESRVPPPIDYVPTPLLSVAGTEDPFFRYSGGSTLLFDVRSVEDSMAYIANLNGLSSNSVTSTVVDEDSCQIKSEFYDSAVAPVESYTVVGGGHATPGPKAFPLYILPVQLAFGPITCREGEFSFIPILVDFFERFGL